MPLLNVKISIPITRNLAEKIAVPLTDLTAEVLKKKRELTSVIVDFAPVERWYIGGASIDAHNMVTFWLDIKITEGTNTKEEKAEYVSKTYKLMESILGNLHPASYIVIHDVSADSWGYEGATQEFRRLNTQAG